MKIVIDIGGPIHGPVQLTIYPDGKALMVRDGETVEIDVEIKE